LVDVEDTDEHELDVVPKVPDVPADDASVLAAFDQEAQQPKAKDETSQSESALEADFEISPKTAESTEPDLEDELLKPEVVTDEELRSAASGGRKSYKRASPRTRTVILGEAPTNPIVELDVSLRVPSIDESRKRTAASSSGTTSVGRPRVAQAWLPAAVQPMQDVRNIRVLRPLYGQHLRLLRLACTAEGTTHSDADAATTSSSAKRRTVPVRFRIWRSCARIDVSGLLAGERAHLTAAFEVLNFQDPETEDY
jgi:hypothetical protein